MQQRPTRNLPRPNYREESDSEQADSFISVASTAASPPVTPLSPSNPRFYYQTSPPPTGQVLSDVVANLRPIEAIQNIIPNWKPLEDEEVQEEEVVQGFIQEEVDNTVQADNMPDAVDF